MNKIDEYFNHYSKETLENFKKYHFENPHVYARFKELAFQMMKSGRKKYSSKLIINIIRWENDLITTGEEFKINDRYQSIYGRLLAFHHPEFETFFEFRVRQHGRK